MYHFLFLNLKEFSYLILLQFKLTLMHVVNSLSTL